MNDQVIENLTDLEFAQVFSVVREKILTDPIRFFVQDSNFINFKPTPGQMVALKCIFQKPLDNVIKHDVYEETVDEAGNFDLIWGKYTEVELFKLMTTFDYDYSDFTLNKNRINLIIGRRGGKSTMASIIAVYSTFKTNWKKYLSKTPIATVAVLSHSVEFSQDILDILRTLFESSPMLSRLRNKKRKDTQSTFHVKIPFLLPNGEVEYSEVAIKVGAASKKTTRGRAVCTLLTDEIAFWNLQENAAESDVDVIRAVMPSLAQFGDEGTIIKLSSPAIKRGVLYEEWSQREYLKAEYLQFKAPSWVWNNILDVKFLKTENKKDPAGFDTEYRANFVDSISNFISSEAVDACVVPGATFIPPSDSRDVIYTAAIDAAFKSDKFAFALVGNNGHRITNHVLKYWEGTKAAPVQSFEVARFIKNICNEYGVSEVFGDQHAFQPLKEIFNLHHITLVENTFTTAYKKKIYFALKRLINNNNIDLLDIPLLSSELKELQVDQTGSGQIRIGHPPGGSDDLSDALGVACFQALEKGNSMSMTSTSSSGASSNYGVKTDIYGKAFTAPAPGMLHNYKGFAEFRDNSHEWVKHPETGQWVKRSELEDGDVINNSDKVLWSF